VAAAATAVITQMYEGRSGHDISILVRRRGIGGVQGPLFCRVACVRERNEDRQRICNEFGVALTEKMYYSFHRNITAHNTTLALPSPRPFESSLFLFLFLFFLCYYSPSSFSQPWSGELSMFGSVTSLMDSPSVPQFRHMVSVGEANTWPKLPRIHAHCDVEVIVVGCCCLVADVCLIHGGYFFCFRLASISFVVSTRILFKKRRNIC
jgi:hypothetical protein